MCSWVSKSTPSISGSGKEEVIKAVGSWGAGIFGITAHKCSSQTSGSASHCLPGSASPPGHLSWHHLISLGELGRPLFLWPHIYARVLMLLIKLTEANNIHWSETGSLMGSLSQCLGLKQGFSRGESGREVCDLDPEGGWCSCMARARKWSKRHPSSYVKPGSPQCPLNLVPCLAPHYLVEICSVLDSGVCWGVSSLCLSPLSSLMLGGSHSTRAWPQGFLKLSISHHFYPHRAPGASHYPSPWLLDWGENFLLAAHHS